MKPGKYVTAHRPSYGNIMGHAMALSENIYIMDLIILIFMAV